MDSTENKRNDSLIASSGSGSSLSSINNPEAYVKEKYGDGFTLQISTGKAQWIFREQSDYSIYAREISPGLSEFEKNCQLASTYEVIDWYREFHGISAIPSFVISVSPELDSFYQEFMSEKTSYGVSLYRIAHRKIPTLYNEIRDWYIANDGYRFDGTHISKASDCVSHLSSRFMVGLSATSSSSYSLEQMKKDSVSGVVTDVFFDSSGPIAHAMPIVGYQTYSKTSGWWTFQHTGYVTLLGVNDNVYPQKRYVDFTPGPSGSVFRVVFSA